VNTVLTRVFCFGPTCARKLCLTSADENGSPLCHLTPWRSLNVHVVGLVSFQSVASDGWSFAVRMARDQVVEQV